MLSQLSTIKARLSIADADHTFDTLLTNAIKAVSARFDRECRRTLARTENATFEFDANDTELAPPCYPIESVAKWEVKDSESTGWQEVNAVDYLVRSGCIITLRQPLSALNSQSATARVTYTGGYVSPGTEPGAGQTPLPDDLEQACVEQVAYWFQNREHLGLKTYWPAGAAYHQFATYDLLEPVKAVLKKHARWGM